MARMIAYHSLLHAVAARPADGRGQLRQAVHSIVHGFVPNDAYTHACAIALRNRPARLGVRARVRETIAIDLNPVAALLSGSASSARFATTWNALHTAWTLAADTRLFPNDDGHFDYVRTMASCLGAEALREEVILHTIEAVSPGAQACAASDGLLPLAQTLGLQREAVHDLLAALQEDPEADIATAARRLGTSVRSLQRVLHQQELGFAETRMAVRLLQAARLLRESVLSVTDIAQQSGFFDAAHFARAFAQSTGVSASRYRAIAQATV